MPLKPHLHIENKHRSGFTLVEFSIVVIISGLLMAAIFSVLNQRNVTRGTLMDLRMERILFGISEHFRIYGFYPCPASLTRVHGTDPLYGESDCRDPAIAATGTNRVPSPIGPAMVLIGGVPTKELNRIIGCTTPESPNRVNSSLFLNRYIDGAGLPFAPELSPSTQSQLLRARDVLTRPDIRLASATRNKRASVNKAQCISDDDSLDSFGAKLIYAVSENSTLPSGAPVAGGGYTATGSGINVIDQNGNSAANPGTVHFVVLSTGPDKKGAIMSTGVPSGIPCPNPSPAFDSTNCDFTNPTFVAMPYAALQTAAAGHYDDRLEFSFIGLELDQDTWGWQHDMLDNTRDLVMNAQGGNASLQVGPDALAMTAAERLRVSNGNLQTDRTHIYVTTTCDDPTAACAAGGSPGGNISAANVNVTSPRAPIDYNDADVIVEVENEVVAQQYCYDPPISCNCGARFVSLPRSSNVLCCNTTPRSIVPNSATCP